MLHDNITGKKDLWSKTKIKEILCEKDKNNKTIQGAFKCDLVSTRIVQLLEEDKFELLVDYIKCIHKYLFKDKLPYFRKTLVRSNYFN